MPSTYTSSLRLTLPATGELTNIWGNTVNTGVTSLVDNAIAGTATIPATAWGGAGVAYTLSNSNGAADEARSMFIVATGNPAEAKDIICPAVSKLYFFRNDTSFTLTLKTPSGTGIAVPAGQYRMLYCDGTNVVESVNAFGSLTLGSPLAAASGGTGLSSPGANGNVLLSNGTTWTSSALPPGGLTYIYTTTPVTLTDKQGALTNTAGGAFTVTLPATPSVGAQVVVADAGNAWGTNNLTVGRNGSTIADLAEDLVCDIAGASVQLVYDGFTWEVYAQVGGNGAQAVTLTGIQTLTNKTIAFGSNTLTDVASTNTSQTLTNKTIAYASNTLTGVAGTGVANTFTSTQTFSSSVVPGTNVVDSVGYTGVPQNSQSAAYTLVAADAGKSIVHPITDNNPRTFTIPANGTVAFPVGTAITFVNMINTVTIAITTDTMYLAGAGTTGSRTLAAFGVATAVKVTSTSWIISGNGLT